MIPSTGNIMMRRATVVSVMRGGSVFFALWTPVPILSWIGEGFTDGDFFNIFYYAGRITAFIVLLVLTIICVFFAKPFSRWIVPIREPRCPCCDHLLTHLTTPRCSECGLQLPDELIQDDTPNIEPPPHQ